MVVGAHCDYYVAVQAISSNVLMIVQDYYACSTVVNHCANRAPHSFARALFLYKPCFSRRDIPKKLFSFWLAKVY